MTPASAPHPPRGWRQTAARAAALLALACLALAAAIGIVGGFVLDAAGVRVSMRTVTTPLGLFAAAMAAAWLLAPGADGRRDAGRWIATPASSGAAIAMLLAAGVVTLGLAAGTWVAGGSDSSGYIAEARMLADGRLFTHEPLATELRVADAPRLTAPLGFRPAPDAAVSGRLVPTYPPGLPLLMAAFLRLFGPAGPFIVVPLAGGAAIWLAFALGRAHGAPAAGLAASAVLATHPSFLFQLLQPMSDVPVTAAWLLAAVAALRGRPGPSGLVTACALLVRPNLLPMALPMAALAIAAREGGVTPAKAGSRWIAGVLPGVIAVAALHTAWYGAPWRSGYGQVDALFGPANVLPNLARYASWAFETGGLLVVPLVLAAAFRPQGPRRAGWLWWVAAANVIAYLPYYVFVEWHYVRFLLPALALLLPPGLAVLDRGLARLPSGRTWALPALVALQCGWQLHVAETHDVFRVAATERRYALTAAWVKAQTPPDAVIVTFQQSGSLAVNASRSVIRWDLAPAGSLDEAIAAARDLRRPVWMVLEGWERPALQALHGSTSFGRLDWPPAAIVRATVPAHVFDLADRDRYLRGHSVPTAYVSDRRR